MKDFYDIWILQKQMDFCGVSLFEAINKTFSNRKTRLDKSSINDLKLLGESGDKAKQWDQFIRKNQFNADTPNFRSIIKTLLLFLIPLIIAIDEGTKVPKKWNIKKR